MKTENTLEPGLHTFKGRRAVVVTDLGPIHSTCCVWLGGNREKWVFKKDLTPDRAKLNQPVKS